jgi:hypothetical protein
MAIQDIPDSYDKFLKWSREYEKKTFMFADDNRTVAECTIQVFLQPVPKFMHHFARRLVYALLEPLQNFTCRST